MTLPPYTPQSREELLEVHASVLLSAPNNFFQLPNLLPGEQATLESSFAELHRGVDRVYHRARHEDLRVRMHELLDAIYAEFKAGRQNEARIMCPDFEALVSDNRP